VAGKLFSYSFKIEKEKKYFNKMTLGLSGMQNLVMGLGQNF